MTIEELLALLLSGDLSAITDEELAQHEATLLTEFDERRNARGAEAVALLGQIADAADAVRVEAGERIAAAEAEAAAVADLEARLRPAVEPTEAAEPAAEPDPAPAAPAPVAEAPAPSAEPSPVAEPVLAAAVPRPAPLSSLASTPPAPQAMTSTIRILGDVTPDPTFDQIVEAMIDVDRYAGRGGRVQRELHPVFNVQGVWEQNRRLERGNQAHNDEIVRNLYSRKALLAAGGFCGPPQPYYNLATISQASTPLRDGLGGLSVAGRGALTFNKPLSLGDFASAITIWTKDNDTGEDNSPSEKGCVEITCTDQETEEVKAFVRCVTISNFMDRYSPEFVAQALDLAMVNWAMSSETDLLDRIKGADKAVTSAQVIGAAADINYTVGLAAAGYRNSDRMLADVGLVAILPAWVLDLYIGDMARSAHHYAEQLRVARATVEGNLANLGVRPVFYIDSPSTGTSQKFGAQGNGALNPYPSAIQWGLAHDGAHVPLDGGPDLNFGVARSPESNKQNQYQAFGESFEGYAFLGVKAWWITQAVCASGTFSAPLDISDICEAS